MAVPALRFIGRSVVDGCLASLHAKHPPRRHGIDGFSPPPMQRVAFFDTCDSETKHDDEDEHDGANDRLQPRRRKVVACTCARTMVGSSDPFDFVDACVELEQMHVSEGREDGMRCVCVSKTRRRSGRPHKHGS